MVGREAKCERFLALLLQVYISRDELQQIKCSAVSKGLSLLGFKPLTALKEYHQLRNPSFIYPGMLVGHQQHQDLHLQCFSLPHASCELALLHQQVLAVGL